MKYILNLAQHKSIFSDTLQQMQNNTTTNIEQDFKLSG
jgi:hypothetical protein